MATGIVEQTTLATDKFVSDRGTEFEIGVRDNGLFFIHMKKGGKAPPMCFEHYTSRKLAERELTLYLTENDRLGNAVHPNKQAKVENAKSKNQ